MTCLSFNQLGPGRGRQGHCLQQQTVSRLPSPQIVNPRPQIRQLQPRRHQQITLASSTSFRNWPERDDDKTPQESAAQSFDLSVYLRPQRPFSSDGSDLTSQSCDSTTSVGQQPLESKITVIQDALDAGHGTIAITVADIAIASHPNDARLLTLRARIKGKLFNDQEGAMADLASAMQLKPHCTWSKLSYAQNKFTQGQKLGALTAMYDISETIHQDNFVVDDKLLKNIVTFLDFLLHHFPEDSRILQQRGYCKAAIKDIQQASEAVQDLTSAIELGLDTAWSFHYRAKAFLVLSRWQEAVTDLERAHLLEPQESSILIDRIAAKRKLHDHAGGIADYNLLEKMRGLDAEQLLSRGNLRQAVGDDEGSKADHRKASLTGLTTMTNLLARANAKFALGDLAGALQDLNHADKVQPGQLAVLKQRGMVKFMLQDLEGFVKDLNGRTDDAYWVWHLAAAKMKLKADQS